MNRARRIGLSIIVIVAVILILIGGGYYFYQQQTYVTTSDASVQGTLVSLSASSAGTLQSWDAPLGNTVSRDHILGKVTGLTGTVDITAPVGGTIVQNNAVNNEVVVPGEPIGYMVNLNALRVIAFVQETSINNVKVGHTVDITIDAYPNTVFTGTVAQIGSASAVIADGIPNTNLSGNFQKQTQRVPVYISIDGTEGKRLLPGLSAVVRIHRN